MAVDPMELVGRLEERAKAARSEGNATALGDAIHFEQSAACIRVLVEQNRRASAPQPEADEGEWVFWGGGENPAPGKAVEAEFGPFLDAPATFKSEALDWSHGPTCDSIRRYRVVKTTLGGSDA